MSRTRMSITPDLRRGVVEFCALALLKEHEQYAAELVRNLADHDGLVTSEGTIYPLLNRLADQGLIDARWESSGGERPRKYYTITTSGEFALHEFRADWHAFVVGVTSILGA